MTNMNLTRVGLVTVALAALPAAIVRADTDIDAIYARVAEGVRTADPDFSRTVYTDAAYLGSFPVPIDRSATVHDAMRASSERLKGDGATMTNSFKLASRQLVGDGLAIDTGYYKIDMNRPTGERRTMTRYNKFLVVAAKRRGGTRKITHDASTAATKAAWEDFKRIGV